MNNKTKSSFYIYPMAVLMLLILPLVNAVLNIVYSAISGDVLISLWADILSCIIYAVTTVTLYAGLGYTVLAQERRLDVKPYLLMYGIGLVLFYGGSIVSDRIFLTDELFRQNLSLSLTTNLLNLAIEAMLFALTLLFTNMHITRCGRFPSPAKKPFARDKANFPSLIPVAVCFVNSFVWAAASTVVDLVTVGLPINLTEVIYLSTPYGIILLSAAVGYFTVRRVMFSRVIQNGQ